MTRTTRENKSPERICIGANSLKDPVSGTKTVEHFYHSLSQQRALSRLELSVALLQSLTGDKCVGQKTNLALRQAS